MDSLKFDLGLACPALLCPAGGPTLRWPYSHLRGGLLAGQAAYGRLLPIWTPHVVRLWILLLKCCGVADVNLKGP
jgi:hypothetical protein